MNDNDLYRMWWYALLYGAGAERRMQLLDEMRTNSRHVH